MKTSLQLLLVICLVLSPLGSAWGGQTNVVEGNVTRAKGAAVKNVWVELWMDPETSVLVPMGPILLSSVKTDAAGKFRLSAIGIKKGRHIYLIVHGRELFQKHSDGHRDVISTDIRIDSVKLFGPNPIVVPDSFVVGTTSPHVGLIDLEGTK